MFVRRDPEYYLVAPNFVEAPDYILNACDKDTYTYPIHGWYWFDTLEQAAEFFGVTLEYLQEHTL
jgi:hypothetical protein